jgi:hypothetical protein
MPRSVSAANTGWELHMTFLFEAKVNDVTFMFQNGMSGFVGPIA